jgi:TonB family protein
MKTFPRISLCLLIIVGMTAALGAQATDARDSLNLGVSAFRNGNFQSAVEHFTRATQLDPSFTNAFLYLGTAYSQMYIPGRTTPENQDYAKKAIGVFEGYLARDPQNESVLAALAKVYQSSQDYTKTRETFLRLTKVAPLDPTNFYAVGSLDWLLVYDKRNPLPEAERARLIAEGIENLDIAIQMRPQYEEALTYKNLLLRQKALMTTDPVEAARLENEATQWFNRALEARRLNGQAPPANSGGFFAAPPPPPPPPPPRVQAIGAPPVRIGGDVAQSNLINKVTPLYPEAARAARVQDYVMMQATIDKTGAVADLKILHGHPLLNEAALDAVKQWRYQPMLLNGVPTEVVTTITVNFSFQ